MGLGIVLASLCRSARGCCLVSVINLLQTESDSSASAKAGASSAKSSEASKEKWSR